jgi:hypothetical protein
LALLLVSVGTAHAIDIAVYTETTQWIGQGDAQGQADIFMAEMEGKPGVDSIENVGLVAMEQWTLDHTVKDGGHLIVMYGDFPETIYPGGNAEPDGSIAEEFLEAGNSFSNSNDYFFWGVGGRNSEGGIQNMMDIPAMVQWDDNTPMTATVEGEAAIPSMPGDLTTDRPFHVDQLDGAWVLEVAFASNTGDQDPTRCDPCIVLDEDTNGRLIQVYQTNGLEQEEGLALAEILQNYYLDSVGALPVEPADKLSTTWAEIKTRR